MLTFMDTISIILPNETNNGKPLDYEPYLKKACESFGGFTRCKVNGGWVDDKTGELYLDLSSRIELSFATFDSQKRIFVESLIQDLLSPGFGGQEAVFVAINGRSVIIDESTLPELIAHLEKTFVTV